MTMIHGRGTPLSAHESANLHVGLPFTSLFCQRFVCTLDAQITVDLRMQRCHRIFARDGAQRGLAISSQPAVSTSSVCRLPSQ